MSFPAFANFPPEIISIIWSFAIWPRLVHIQDGDSFEHLDRPHLMALESNVHQLHPRGDRHLYSTSPIPPMLHVCRESRKMKIAQGYELAFGVREEKARIWFNFKIDILYCSEEDKFEYFERHAILRTPGSMIFPEQRPPLPIRRSDRFSRYCLEQASREELLRIERIAVPQAERNPYTNRPSLGMFLGVEEYFVVEEHCSNNNKTPLGQKRDNHGDLWRCVGCDVPETLGHCLPDGVSLAYRYYEKLMAHSRRNGGSGRQFFKTVATFYENELFLQRRERHERAIQPFGELDEGINDSTPIVKVRVVVVTTCSGAQRLIQKRQQYWDKVNNEEMRIPRLPSCSTPPSIPSSPPPPSDPPSPFSATYADDEEALIEVNQRLAQHSRLSRLIGMSK